MKVTIQFAVGKETRAAIASSLDHDGLASRAEVERFINDAAWDALADVSNHEVYTLHDEHDDRDDQADHSDDQAEAESPVDPDETTPEPSLIVPDEVIVAREPVRWRDALRDQGQTLAWLARKTQKSRWSVYHYSSGQEQPPSAWLDRVSAVLGVEVTA